ncbi:uncharacterized protein LOC125371672 [Haliotis rufescens]|uniref:uncharacterized protein LOC125371672 n=1 Tax=Haliotis rufescens TaxID=6454 RepID=UPI00201F720B|nr:uncharacterized protein LOC125371672 [Haliotis rufescens]
MAMHKTLTDNFLTCSICMEVFDDPCTLVCYHTFCRKCVVSYTETRPEAISAKSLLCPFCRKMTKVANSNRPVEEWTQEVKPSFLIRGLMDSFAPCSQGTNNCNLCDEDGETTPANAWCVECNVSLCDGCLKAHRRIPATRHHDVSDLSRDVKVKKRRKPMCKEHPDQRMQFYCKDCKKLQCQSCCILYHRKCESIVSLESVLPEMQNTLQSVKQKLESDLATSNTRLAKKGAQCTEINKNKSSLQSQVRSATHTAIDLIKKKERQLLEQIDDVTEKQIGQLKGDMNREEMARQMIRQHSELLGRALESESDMDICEMYLWSESEEAATVCVPESGMEDVSGGKACFIHDRHLMCEELNDLHLGVIDIIVEDVFDSTSTAVLYDTVDIQAEDDKKKPNGYDVAVFVVDNTDIMVVTDYDNRCVKSFYKRNKMSCQSKLGVQSGPRCIAKLNNNKMAVTLPDTKKIIIVEVKPELVLQSSISTRKWYVGLTSLTPTTLAAGSGDPPYVDILDMAGNVLRTLDPVTDGERLVSCPWYLSTTRQGNILVSCCVYGARNVLCLTSHGDVVFRYQPKQKRHYAHGITETNAGHILVIIYNAKCVIQLSASGTFVRKVLTSRDGITSPHNLYLSESQHLYVIDGDCVKIYRFTMAMHKTLTDNFLTYSICMDVFDDPCTLVCYHTFCRKCVVSYTETRPEAISAKSLLCPFCRKMTKVADSNRPVEEWAQEDGETTPANAWCVECNVSLCDGCLKAHRRIPATRHHDVCDLSRDVKVKKRRKPMCKEHPDQRMQFYCKDCKKLQCQSCCILYHRKCESIVSLESVLPEMQNTLQSVKQKLESDLATSNTRLAKKGAQCTEINKNKSSLQSQVRSATHIAIDLIKKKERQLLEQIDDVTEKQIGQLIGDMKREEMARQMIRQHSEFLGRALKSESDVDICEMYLWSESEEAATVCVPESGMDDVSGGKACFIHDRHLMCGKLNDLHLGVIDIIVDVFDSPSTAVLYDTVDIQAEDDEKKPNALDVAVFVVDNTDTTVVTDHGNKCVKSFYKRNKMSCQSKLGVQSAPRCIAKLNNNKMAVTLPDTKKIIIVEVKPELVLQSSISTRQTYEGLTSLTPTTLAAGSVFRPCVDILDMAGNVLRTLDPVTDGERLVLAPCFLSTTRQGNILVSCLGYAHRVLCLTPHGDVVFRYHPTQQSPSARGITKTNTGHILVIDLLANCVIQLSASGTYVRKVLTSRDGITSPYGVCLSESQHLYVTTGHCVKIYRFTRNT